MKKLLIELWGGVKDVARFFLLLPIGTIVFFVLFIVMIVAFAVSLLLSTFFPGYWISVGESKNNVEDKK